MIMGGTDMVPMFAWPLHGSRGTVLGKCPGTFYNWRVLVMSGPMKHVVVEVHECFLTKEGA